jgi:hypothetical protein
MRVAIVCGLGLLGGLVGVGCSSSSSSSAPSADAGAEGSAPEAQLDPLAKWSCLGNVKVPAPPSATTPYDFQLVDPVNDTPVKGATVKTCAFSDTECASPIETATTPDTGIAPFTKLPTTGKGFDGFFEVKIGTEQTNLNFSGIPIWTKFPKSGRLYWGDTQIGVVLKTGSLKQDPSLGLIGIQAHDCTEMPGGVPCNDKEPCPSYTPGGVAFDIDNRDPRITRVYVTINGNAVAASTTAAATTPLNGNGGFLNVPPGPVTVTAKVVATGQQIGTYKLFVRAGAMSLLTAQPQ